MAQQNWSTIIGPAIAALASTNPVHGTLLQPNSAAESTMFALRVPPKPKPPKSGASREATADEIVSSEADSIAVIWRDRPLLIWQGAILQMEISHAKTGELLWNQAVSLEDRCVAYTGKPLQPGQCYEWRLGNRHGDSLTGEVVTFQVLGGEERECIAAALAEKEAALQAEEASPEAIALERAAYFAEQGLWTDVLMEAFSVNNPSTDLMKLLIALSSPN